jgi:hypothetical protein
MNLPVPFIRPLKDLLDTVKGIHTQSNSDFPPHPINWGNALESFPQPEDISIQHFGRPRLLVLRDNAVPDTRNRIVRQEKGLVLEANHAAPVTPFSPQSQNFAVHQDLSLDLSLAEEMPAQLTQLVAPAEEVSQNSSSIEEHLSSPLPDLSPSWAEEDINSIDYEKLKNDLNQEKLLDELFAFLDNCARSARPLLISERRDFGIPHLKTKLALTREFIWCGYKFKFRKPCKQPHYWIVEKAVNEVSNRSN